MLNLHCYVTQAHQTKKTQSSMLPQAKSWTGLAAFPIMGPDFSGILLHSSHLPIVLNDETGHPSVLDTLLGRLGIKHLDPEHDTGSDRSTELTLEDLAFWMIFELELTAQTICGLVQERRMTSATE